MFIHGQLPSKLIFAQGLLKMLLFSLVYCIVSVKGPVIYITDEILTSRHDCVFEVCTCNLDLPKMLDNCKMYTRYCSKHRNKVCPFYILYFIKKPHRLLKEA